MNRVIWQYFSLTFLVSWMCWLPLVLRSQFFPELPEAVGVLGFIATYGPMLASFYLIRRETGWSGLRQFIKRAINLDFDRKWLFPTILLFPIVGLIVTTILALSNRVPEWSPATLNAAPIIFIFILFFGGGFEEFGWRGYALEPLQTRYGNLVASVIIGVVWGLWHLPLHFIDGMPQASIPIWQFTVQAIVLSILYTWLYNNTNGSLLMAILFHTIGNTTTALLPAFYESEFGRWVNLFVLLVIVALVVLSSTWQSKREPQLPHVIESKI